MEIKFTKMHGIGNDYIYIDCFRQSIDGVDLSQLAAEMSRRRYSVGSDGVIYIMPSEIATVKMRMFNADGSEGKMCGNGVRCVAKYVYDSGITNKKEIAVETLSGIKNVKVFAENGKVVRALVDMGKAVSEPSLIPVKSETNNITLEAGGRSFDFTCFSMGNPHAVTVVESLDFDIERYGRLIEQNEIFPERTNVEFIKIISSTEIQMRVWERGSGETLACGTGASAAAVSSCTAGKSPFSAPITVKLLGGDLKITVQSDLTVMMEGDAETVFEGVYHYES